MLTRPRLTRLATLLFAVLIALSACSQDPAAVPPPPDERPEEPAEEKPEVTPGVPIIFDTDLGYDCDDAGALAVLHGLADLGEANPLATMTVVGAPHSAGALDVINTYYGRPDLPVGAYAGERWADAKPYWLDPGTSFLEPLVTDYPSDIETRADAQEATALYRRTLAAQPDGSVTIVTVGFLQNMADLLASPADAVSDLSGEALVARKVKQLVVMGGRYPANGEEMRDFNLSDGPDRDGKTAQRVVETWPTPIIFSGNEVSDDVHTGSVLQEMLPENPVARAYDLFPGTNSEGERASWDLVAVLYAVRGEGDMWRLRKDSHIVIDDDGSHTWEPGAVSPARMSLIREAPAEEVETILDGLLARFPQGETGAPESPQEE